MADKVRTIPSGAHRDGKVDVFQDAEGYFGTCTATGTAYEWTPDEWQKLVAKLDAPSTKGAPVRKAAPAAPARKRARG